MEKLYEPKQLRHCSTAMYDVLGPLQEAVSLHAYNKGKRWSDAECETVRKYVRNPWNTYDIMLGCVMTGRTPYSIFNCFVYVMWEEFKAGRKEMYQAATDSMPA